MAALGHPPPLIYSAVLDAVCGADPRRDTAVTAFGDLIAVLDDSQAAVFAPALGGILRLLAGDADRMRFAASAIAQFDMADAAGHLVEAALGTRDRDLILAACTVCGNPAVSQDVRSKMEKALERDRPALMRLRPDISPETAGEKLLYQQCWPGSREREGLQRLPAVVVLDRALGARAVLLAALRIIGHGGVVKQLDADNPVPDWFGPATVLVCAEATAKSIPLWVGGLLGGRFIVAPAISSEEGVVALMRRINAALPPGLKLQIADTGSDSAKDVWDPEVYGLGSYSTSEASYLTSASIRLLYALARDEVLNPRLVGKRDTPNWSFKEIVGVRAWRYMRLRTGRRISTAVAQRLVDFPGDEDGNRVGVTSDGRVWSERPAEDGIPRWMDVLTGEQIIPMKEADLTSLDSVFEPFYLRGGTVPGLLRVSAHTGLHPASLNGQPRLDGHRIPARSLAALDSRGGRSTILAAYPELEEVQFNDTVRVGHELAGAARR